MARDYSSWTRPRWLDILFPLQIERREFVIRSAILWVLLAPVWVPTEKWLLSHYTFEIDTPTKIRLIVTLVIAVLFWTRYAVLPRLKDLSWSPKLAWLIAVPPVNLGLLIMLIMTAGKIKRS